MFMYLDVEKLILCYKFIYILWWGQKLAIIVKGDLNNQDTENKMSCIYRQHEGCCIAVLCVQNQLYSSDSKT